MPRADTRIAVLVFGRAPGRERRRLRLGRRADVRVRTSLLHDTLASVSAGRDDAGLFFAADGIDEMREIVRERGRTAARSALGWHWLRQRGRTFGDRLLAALRDVAAHGYDRIVVVGTDTPGIRPGDIRRACAAAPGEIVVGPATDGGVYLLSVPADAIPPLADLPWRDARLGSELRATFLRLGRGVHSLEVRADVDTPVDARRARGLLAQLCRFVLGLRLSEAPALPATNGDALRVSAVVRSLLPSRAPPTLRFFA
ncbi:MAG: DUF2064 domain-containing protein [Gemmatimonadetes bacterium]|nr:DUF2064 domain-containing protein [Gemmatimonadota bacterium]